MSAGLKVLCEQEWDERGPHTRRREGRRLWPDLQQERGKTSQQVEVALKKRWNPTDYSQGESIGLPVWQVLCAPRAMEMLQLGIAWLVEYQERVITLLWESKKITFGILITVPFSRWLLSKTWLNGQRVCVCVCVCIHTHTHRHRGLLMWSISNN